MAIDLKTATKDLNAQDWKTRMEAVRQMELLGGDDAASGLVSTLQDDPSPFVRTAAARSLGTLKNAASVEALTQALSDPQFHVRQASMWALGRIGAPAASALDAIRPFRESDERFSQAELTVSELAAYTVSLIEVAVADEKAAAAEAEAGETAGAEGQAQESERKRLSAEERRAKREAAMARKQAKAEAEGDQDGS